MSDASNFGMDDVEGDAQVAGSGVGVVKVGKRDYAVGLHWNSVEVPGNAAKEARAMAKGAVKADLFCVRVGLTTQFGLGFKSLGHKPRQPSLAAHLASVKSGSWIGLFEVSGGYYLIAVREDGIIAETDRFFASSEDAQYEFENLYGQSDWGDTYGPASLDIPGTRPESLDTLVSGKPPARLSEVDLSKTMLKIAFGAVVVIGGIFGGQSYLDSVEAQRIADEAAAQAERARKMLTPESKTVQVPPMPWENQPLAVPTVAACVEAANGFHVDMPGWRVAEVFCEGSSIAVAIDRLKGLTDGGAPVTWLAPAIKRPGFEPEITYPPDGSGSRVRVSWPLTKAPSISPAITTLKIHQVKRSMLEVMESRWTPINFSDADTNEFWKGLAFRFTTKQSPTAFGDLLGAVPGVIISRIHHNVDTGDWSLEGKVYEQLPLPENAKRQ